MLQHIKRRIRNFYVLSTLIFIVWMIFLDSNNLLNRYSLSSKLGQLESEKEYYEMKIQEVSKDRQELFGDRESLEKFAREKYLMKKPTEDIYIIEQK